MLSRSLTHLDWSILATLVTVRAATGGQLARCHFAGVPSGDRQCRRHLAHLVERRLLGRLDRRVGGRPGSDSYVYALDVAGQRLATSRSHYTPRRPWTPGRLFLDHTLAVTEVYTKLIEAERLGKAEVLAFATEPTCWRSFYGLDLAPAVLKPDAFVRVGVPSYELVWFLEVDRATVGPSALVRQLDAYRSYWQSGQEVARHGVFPAVLWAVPDEARRDAVAALIARQPTEAQALHRVALVEGAVAVLTGGQP